VGSIPFRCHRSARQTGGEHNRSLAASKATLAQAQDLRWRRRAHVPAVDLTAGVGRQQYGAQFWAELENPPLRTSPWTTVSYTLDYTGGVARSVEEAVRRWPRWSGTSSMRRI